MVISHFHLFVDWMEQVGRGGEVRVGAVQSGERPPPTRAGTPLLYLSDAFKISDFKIAQKIFGEICLVLIR